MRYPHPVPTKIGLALTALMAVTLSVPVKTQTAEVQPDPYAASAFRKAFFDASKVYGKAGCGDINLAELTARNAIRTNLPASLIASVVSVESNCNPLAVSNKGAIGIMQVNVQVQAEKFGHFRTINLLNVEQGMETGTDILSGMIKTWGLRAGVSHYNGSGPDAEAYAVKVLQLAGK